MCEEPLHQRPAFLWTWNQHPQCSSTMGATKWERKNINDARTPSFEQTVAIAWPVLYSHMSWRQRNSFANFSQKRLVTNCTAKALTKGLPSSWNSPFAWVTNPFGGEGFTEDAPVRASSAQSNTASIDRMVSWIKSPPSSSYFIRALGLKPAREISSVYHRQRRNASDMQQSLAYEFKTPFDRRRHSHLIR